MFNDHSNQEERHDFEYEIDFIKYSHKSFVYGLYTRLNQFERHYESITTRYRNIALTWLLATFAGIGFLLSIETQSLLIDHLVGVMLISFIGIIGISLIWHLDMNVYHRFWTALFVEEVMMEEQHDFILQSKRTLLLIDKSREKLFAQGWLYLMANILLIITLGVTIFHLSKNLPLSEKILILAGLLVFFAGIVSFMLHMGKDLQKSLMSLLASRRQEIK